MEGAILFAREFCRMSTFYLRLCLEADSPDDYHYGVDVAFDYFEDMEFLVWLLAQPPDGEAARRAEGLRALFPRED